MKKEQRLKKNEEFSAVFKKGHSMANRQFVLYILPKEGQTSFRLGLSVSKRVGNAVCRNRIKRLIRVVFQDLEGQLKTDCDYVVIARLPARDLGLKEVQSSLEHVMRKSKALRRSHTQRTKIINREDVRD
ncbi:ribonuclease P protein component [Alkalihalobacillus xiaoxiensis]|uniref:Ribonuclease P protein component n=1 Tax=Shouchella xiaoxiensis TaxID=766895 RepID=A0ABS2SZM3_9BACI|nr:ribonuclease P protein component [Shouchella xiaoxiensis]MBM7840981.1 ribonuclease P protein component [Shouchella xiaoxiensis]